MQNSGAPQIAFSGFAVLLWGVSFFFCCCIGSKSLKPSFITELLIFIWPKGSLDIFKIKKRNSILIGKQTSSSF